MSGRSTLLAVLIVLLLAATLSLGCGGGDEVITTSSTIAVTPTLPPGGSTGTVNDLLFTSLTTTEDTPREYVEAVEQGRPVVLLFYVTGSADDASVLESLTRLQSAFGDYVFLLYDYKTPSVYGDLSTLLKVSYPPELVLVDGTGTIQEIWNGYVDEGTLNQSLVNLGQV
ncbi:MAG: hypothetical protein V1912_13545 [bacterium]